MFNLKQLLEKLICEAMEDEGELIPTDKLPSAVVIAERISQLESALHIMFPMAVQWGESFGANPMEDADFIKAKKLLDNS